MRNSYRRHYFGFTLVTLAASGCFYDSSWGEAKRVQQRHAAYVTPASLDGKNAPSVETASAAASPPLKRTFRIRVHATPAYVAQTLDWSRRVREMVEDANRVLQTSFHVSLEVESMGAWDNSEKAASGDEGLNASLKALKSVDAGEHVDWVVGLVGGLPRLTESFHEVGMAELFSKHMVLRAAGRLGEHDDIDKAFDELNDEERTRLRNQRRRHRATAVFLHEIGHTLGAAHELDRQSLMYSSYRTDMERFGDGATAWMAISLAHRTEHRVIDDQQAFAVKVLPPLRTATTWVPRERDDMVKLLESARAPAVETAATPAPVAFAPAPAAPALPDDVAALSEEDRGRFVRVLEAKNSGDVTAAWTVGKPLFAKHLKVYSVQDLRCQLATVSGLSWTVARAECEPLMQLARDPKRARTP